ncbi:hypothetical protein LTR64_006208 [Lithohypha guttulata]|uniref:uncharacterized protein n=1 Tax=Lithohypha guttulata TaxID=1690604 RepID=UPI002DE15036|nr:hypothetical protein LTR51_001994 [Lithohypha guttulata]
MPVTHNPKTVQARWRLVKRTHDENHVCSDISLFTELQMPPNSLKTWGKYTVYAIGTVRFKVLQASPGTPTTITLTKVLYVPDYNRDGYGNVMRTDSTSDQRKLRHTVHGGDREITVPRHGSVLARSNTGGKAENGYKLITASTR